MCTYYTYYTCIMVKQRLSMLGTESHDYATIVNLVIGGRLPFMKAFSLSIALIIVFCTSDLLNMSFV